MMTAQTVQQLLNVFRLTRDNHASGKPLPNSYHQAVREVARLHSVTYQTIGDGCRRRLNLKDIPELYKLLGAWLDGDASGLAQQLKQNSDLSAHADIDQFFTHPRATAPEKKLPVYLVSRQESETFTFRLNANDARMLKALAELEGTTPGALASRVVFDAVRARMTTIARGIVKKADGQGANG